MPGFTDTKTEEEGSYTVIPCPFTPTVVEFFSHSGPHSSLLACGGGSKFQLLALHFPEVEQDLCEFSCELLYSETIESAINGFCWSPKTSLQVHPVNLTFCITTWDHDVFLYSLDFKKTVSIQKLGSHHDYVNDCDFNPVRGTEVASVGDDNVLYVWSTEGGKNARVPLSGAGVSVKYNQMDPGKLMVAERCGRIRFYNSATLQPIISFESSTVPISHCDWSMSSMIHIGAVVAGQWMVWDVSRSGLPIMSGQLGSQKGQLFRWCKSSERVFATKGLPSGEVKVTDVAKNKVILTTKITSGSGLSWHADLPILVTGAHDRLILWNLQFAI